MQHRQEGTPIAICERMRLLIGLKLELAARQLTVAATPNEISRENIYAGMIEPIVDPLIRIPPPKAALRCDGVIGILRS